MPESKPIYIIYETTNLVNGKYYIGAHKQIGLEFDGYLGSGKLISLAIKKYTKENFMRDVLFVFDDCKNAYDMEEKIVNRAIVCNRNSYNLVIGGYSGHLEARTPESLKKLSKSHKGFFTAKDANNNTYRITKKDPRWISGELVGNRLGLSHKLSEKTKNKMKTSHTGLKHSYKHKESIRKALTGVPHTEERKKNISKGRALPFQTN